MRKAPDNGHQLRRMRWTPLLLFILAGCTQTPHVGGPSTIDPLVGGAPIPNSAPQGNPPTATAVGLSKPQPAGPQTTLPPLPAPNSATSTAALAAGSNRTRDTGIDLRISNPRGSTDGWVGQGPAPTGGGGGGAGVVLGAPSQVSEVPQPRDPAPGFNPGSPRSAPADTYEQAQAQLAQRGVIWQRLETVAETGDWKFICSVPNRQNPNVRRTYEATARDPLGAVRAVLEQIDRGG